MENLLMYILIAAMMVIVPGVDFILVTKNTVSLGTRAGQFTILGVATGLIIWTIVAILGLATIFSQSVVLFNLIKYLGAAYLLILGIKSLKHKNTVSIEIDHSQNNAEANNRSSGQYKSCFWQGFLSNVLNPKTVVVYITLMPQFIHTNQNVLLQLVILGAILIFIAILWFLIVVHVLNFIRIWFKKPKVQSMFNKVTGVMLVSLAVKLALENR
jgi:RhtB (resistance to homoserine/threonine) family protein